MRICATFARCAADTCVYVRPYDKRKADKYWQRLRVVSNSKGRGGFKEMAHALNKKHAPPPFTTNAANVTWWRAQVILTCVYVCMYSYYTLIVAQL